MVFFRAILPIYRATFAPAIADPLGSGRWPGLFPRCGFAAQPPMR
jgi:hypothetical protein